jgi:hypothetical protein
MGFRRTDVAEQQIPQQRRRLDILTYPEPMRSTALDRHLGTVSGTGHLHRAGIPTCQHTGQLFRLVLVHDATGGL